VALHPPPPLSPPPPTPPIIRFSILTFGLRTLNLAGTHPNKDILARALAATWPDIRADVFIDARLFNDPDQHGVGQGHTGMHRDILTRIACHSQFSTWWQQQIKDVVSLPPQHRGSGCVEISVAIYCNAGKHRSVAASIFLEVGLRSRGFTVSSTRHLSSESWPRCKGTCNQCSIAHAQAASLLQDRRL